MSTRRVDHNHSEGSLDTSLAKPTGQENQAPSSKYTLKKRKKATKWTPFDLGAAESTSECGSQPESATLSRAASPAPVTATASSSITARALPLMVTSTPNSPSTTAVPFPTLEQFRHAPSASASASASSCGDAQPVPTEVAPSPAVAAPSLTLDETNVAAVQVVDGFLTATNYLHIEGRESQAPQVMATPNIPSGAERGKERSDNSYNSSEWNPELPPVLTAPRSPQPSPTPAQPVTYTTVGSIVDPNAAPQFTAPNRIQREGSSRRTLGLAQNRQYDSFYAYRGQTSHMSTGLHHGHLPVQSPNLFDLPYGWNMNAPRSPLPNHHFQQNYSLTEQERGILTNIHGHGGMNTFAGPSQNSSATAPPPNHSIPPTNMNQPSFGLGSMTDDEARRRSIGTQGPGAATGAVQGLEKMQTLQRLARFDNPMQSLALSRLSEFSVSRSSGPGPSSASADPRLAQSGPVHASGSPSGTLHNTGAGTQQPGELNRAYRFPLTTAGDSAGPQANPLFGAFSPSTMRSSNNPMPPPPSYPAPLTAGPPGQRQFHGTVNRAPIVYPNAHWRSGSQSFTSAESSSARSESQDTQYYFQSIIPSHNRRKCKTPMVDTLDYAAVSKYYPRGIPPDMHRNSCPLSPTMRRELDVAAGDTQPETSAEKAAKKAKDLEDWFYDGQRRYVTMTGADHIREYEDRQLASVNAFGSMGSMTRQPLAPAQNAPWSEEDINKMSMQDASAPLLNAGFGSLLTYMTSTGAPLSSRVLSRFVSSPAWHLDETANGNKSYYDEKLPPSTIDGDVQYN